MDPQRIAFGGGYNGSFMSPIVLVAMVLTIALFFVLPRKRITAPFLMFMFLTPLGQEFYVGGVHLFAQRIVILVGCFCVFLVRRPSDGGALAGGFNDVDKIFLGLALVQAVGTILVYQQTGAVIAAVGTLWDFLGGYFLVRSLIRDEEDIHRIAGVFVVIAVIMAACMIYEKTHLTNVFALLMGGRVVPDLRNGHVRCRGVFGQEILASAFGGTLAPLFLWLWKDGKSKLVASAGVAASMVIMLTSSSSTGVSAFGFGVLALCMWPLRRRMRVIRWGIVAVVLALAVTMKAPIWYLMARVDFAGGSTGWDRAHLVNVFANHFWGWWLIGSKDYMNWMGVDYGWDLCNQFVANCAQGGLAALALLIALISRSFGRIGKARKLAEGDPKAERLLWVLGAVLAAHMAAFMGISYFDQSRVWWYVTLAMITAAAMPVTVSKPAPVEVVPAETEVVELDSVSAHLV
jgi:hypothetical protein